MSDRKITITLSVDGSEDVLSMDLDFSNIKSEYGNTQISISKVLIHRGQTEIPLNKAFVADGDDKPDIIGRTALCA